MSAQLETIENRAPAIREDVSTQSLVFDPDAINNMMRMAEMMAKATVTVPKHLTGKPADCLAVIMQAAQFRLNPFAVAQKTHIVNGQLGYEAQLVNSVVQSSGAIRGRFHYEYRGEGANIECRVGAVISGERDITWGEWLSAASVQTKNSPLWKTNPKQQLGYLQVKNWARQYAPGAILGVYSADELHDTEPRDMGAADVILDDQPAPRTRAAGVKAKLAAKRDQPAQAPAPADTIYSVLSAIATATTADELASITARAAMLEGDDKAIARKAWTDRKRALDTPQDAPQDDTLSLESIMAGIAAAKTEDDVLGWADAARDCDLSDHDRAAITDAVAARIAAVAS